MRTTRIHKLILLITTFAGVALAQKSPSITSTLVDFRATPPTLLIAGQNFGSVAPTVTLEGKILTIQSFSPMR